MYVVFKLSAVVYKYCALLIFGAVQRVNALEGSTRILQNFILQVKRFYEANPKLEQDFGIDVIPKVCIDKGNAVIDLIGYLFSRWMAVLLTYSSCTLR